MHSCLACHQLLSQDPIDKGKWFCENKNCKCYLRDQIGGEPEETCHPRLSKCEEIHET